ncbi:hypothetical protein KSX_24070 [Ktedonospora formicarum]|uniref:Uncharacterized protein n=1 Tax=Ktedonospora formicarum TaxID=2778364 RepID=A0A8J3I3M0_9CHLR|nr:hypothetical protein KSX_24070 [Ktedonospora formicarum]
MSLDAHQIAMKDLYNIQYSPLTTLSEVWHTYLRSGDRQTPYRIVEPVTKDCATLRWLDTGSFRSSPLPRCTTDEVVSFVLPFSGSPQGRGYNNESE